MNNFSSLISLNANCKEYSKELPNSENSPVRGAINPTLSVLSSSALIKLELAEKIM